MQRYPVYNLDSSKIYLIADHSQKPVFLKHRTIKGGRQCSQWKNSDPHKEQKRLKMRLVAVFGTPLGAPRCATLS